MPFAARFMATSAGPFGWYSPTPNNLPGGGTLQDLVNGFAGDALIVGLAALVIGAAAWYLGKSIGQVEWAVRGAQAFVACGAGVLLIGAAPFLLAAFYSIGQKLH